MMPFIGCLGQVFNHAKTERFLAAGNPKHPLLVEHPQVHKIDVGAVKDHDLARFNAGLDFYGNLVSKAELP